MQTLQNFSHSWLWIFLNLVLGVLTQGQLDNGRGRARLNMFRHLHEIQTGRTSSISHEILGFDSEGNSVDYSTCSTAEEICENATKLLTFIDLAGHQRYVNPSVPRKI